MSPYSTSVNVTFTWLAKLCARTEQGLISLTKTVRLHSKTTLNQNDPIPYIIAIHTTSTLTQIECLLPSLQFPRKMPNVEIKWLVKNGGEKNVQMQALVLAMHTLSLIHEGTILWRGGGGLDDTKVIKVSKQVNVKSGSNSDLFLCQRIMSLIYSPYVPLNINQACIALAWHVHSNHVEKLTFPLWWKTH